MYDENGILTSQSISVFRRANKAARHATVLWRRALRLRPARREGTIALDLLLPFLRGEMSPGK